MTWNILALIIAVIVIMFQYWRTQTLYGCARRVADQLVDVRIALRYIAAGKTFPHDHRFAQAILDGNYIALSQGFASYATFRALELERQEEDDAD